MTRMLVAAFLICATSLAVRAEQTDKKWYDLYNEAVKDVQRRDWAAAEAKLLDAKRIGPRPGPRVLQYGGLRPPYFPDFYLGIVYLNTNRPKEAVAAFQVAKGQSIDTSQREFQQFDALMQRAIDTANAVAANAAKPPSVEPAPKPEVPVAKPIDTGAATAAATRQRFDDLIAQAKSQLAQRNYAAALVSAGQARDLQVDHARADSMIQEIERLNLTEQISSDIKAGDLSNAESKLDRLRKLDPNGADVQRFADAIGSAKSTVNAAALLATAERNAMRQFYAGDYQRALRVLGDLQKTQPLSPRASFYRACSLAAIALSKSDQIDVSQLTEARRQYADSVKAGDQFQRDRRFISPKIIKALTAR